MPVGRRRIEEILVEAELATAQEVARAHRRAVERGSRLLAELSGLPGIDSSRLTAVLAQAYGLPIARRERLRRVAAPRTPSRRAALRALAIERVLLPIGARRDPLEVEVAMFDPTDEEAIERLSAICGGAAVRVTVAPRYALLDAIAQTYGRQQSGVLGAVDPADDLVIHDDHAQPPRAASAPPAPVVVAEEPDLASRLGAAPEVPPPPPPGSRRARSEGGESPRLARVLSDCVSLLADLLEERTAHGPRLGKELARLTRLVSLELGQGAAVADELALVAQLHAVERALADDAADRGQPAPSLADALGWSAAAPGGIGETLRELRAAGVPHRGVSAPSIGFAARLVLAVREYLVLAMATPDGRPERITVNQLLRVTTPPEIIDALQRVLAAEGDKERSHAG